MIDARAVVDPAAQIDTEVYVGPYAVIGADVRVGRGTRIEPHTVVKGPTTIGADNHIFQFASIGDDPQDKKYKGERTRLVIGDRNTIRECCTINRGTAQDLGVTTIGNDNWIMAYVHVAHDCVVGDHVILGNCATLAGHVHVDDWAILGGFAKIHQFCHVGAHAFCGMDCGVTRDVPPYVTVSGIPADPHGINSEGLKRRGYTPEQLRAIKQAYRWLYREKLKLEDARTRIAELARTEPVLALFEAFFARATRSIVR